MENSKKGFYIAIVVALVLITGIWIWKDVQLSNLEKECENRDKEIKNQYTQQILEIQTQDLKSIIKPLVWAVRSEMLKNNLTDINFYIAELVKEKGFQFILLTDEKNVILSSTNKKWEGKPVEVSGISSDLSGDSTIVKTVNNNIILAGAPVMGFNKRLGTVIISFSVAPPPFK
ncbi:MAG: hypothetical protein M3Q95_03080 [Bacteroidota bacterium]|nr:hypothetical protein [Bacteroidota bacterium]